MFPGGGQEREGGRGRAPHHGRELEEVAERDDLRAAERAVRGLGDARGQIEGALSTGMTPRQTMRHITLPQAIANVMPPLLGQTAVLIKDTSLLSIIAVFELLGAGLLMFSETVVATESYVTVAVCYLAIYAMMLVLSGIVQNRLGGSAWQAN